MSTDLDSLVECNYLRLEGVVQGQKRDGRRYNRADRNSRHVDNVVGVTNVRVENSLI